MSERDVWHQMSHEALCMVIKITIRALCIETQLMPNESSGKDLQIIAQ